MPTLRGSETAIELHKQYDLNRQTAAALSRDLTHDQLRGRPPGAWSVAECLDHLARTNTLFGSAMTTAVAQPTPRRGHGGLRVPRSIEAWMVRAIEPPVRIRFTAPATLRPISESADENILAKYFDSHGALLAVLDGAVGKNRAPSISPSGEVAKSQPRFGGAPDGRARPAALVAGRTGCRASTRPGGVAASTPTASLWRSKCRPCLRLSPR
jgi:hypothetical protein